VTDCSREDAELEIGRRNLLQRVEERRGPEIAGPRELPQLVDLVIGADHRLLEPGVDQVDLVGAAHDLQPFLRREDPPGRLFDGREHAIEGRLLDRKSTRLNSSHDQISYAVFCLKKKNTE